MFLEDVLKSYDNGLEKSKSPLLDEANKTSLPMASKEKFRTAPEIARTKLTTKILNTLGDRTTVSKQFIENLTNQGDVKQVERELIRDMLK